MKESNIKRTRYQEIDETEELNLVRIPEPTNQKKPEEEKRKNPFKSFFIIIILTIIAFLCYSSFVGTKLIDIKEYKIETNKVSNSFHGLKIVHFSDIHYGTTINKKELDKIVTKINKLKPDIIFFTGDLVDKNITGNENTEQELIKSLSKIEAKLYKYAIYGNEDLENDYYKNIMESSNFKILDNESTLLYYKDNTPIQITGFNSVDTNPNYTILTNLVDEIDTTNFYKIVLTHEPDTIDNFINYNPDLVFSGHTLGGLIKLPFIKPLFLPENNKKYYEDHYKINNTELYISNGLGTSAITARFNNHPSINFYRLYKID